MISYVVLLKLCNTQSRISVEILKQCSLNLAPENVHHKRNKMAPIVLLPSQQLCHWSQVSKLTLANSQNASDFDKM